MENIHQYITEFEDYLKEENLKQKTIENHVGRLGFFLESYLAYNIESIEDLSSITILDFLGRFYIHKVWFTSESELSGLITTLKKWVIFLRKKNRLDDDIYEEIHEVLKEKQFFVQRFESYERANDEDSLMHWMDVISAYQEYLEDKELTLDEGYEPIELPKDLVQLWENHKLPIPPITEAFQRLLLLLQDDKGVKLTSSTQSFTKPFLEKVDEHLRIIPEGFYVVQKRLPLYQFFIS